MNILVCVKQVPDTTEIKIDPVKNTLIRDGVPSILNPFDGYALEAAAALVLPFQLGQPGIGAGEKVPALGQQRVRACLLALMLGTLQGGKHLK